MRLRTKKKRKKARPKKKKSQKNKKNEIKREKGQCYYPFTTLVLQSSTMIFMIESLLCCRFHILVGFFIIELGLYIPMMGFLKFALGLREQASWMHTHLVSFVELSYTYSSSASVAWQSLLTHIDIVDVRLSSPFCLLHNHHSIPRIVLCPWLTLTYCVKVEKV